MVKGHIYDVPKLLRHDSTSHILSKSFIGMAGLRRAEFLSVGATWKIKFIVLTRHNVFMMLY